MPFCRNPQEKIHSTPRLPIYIEKGGGKVRRKKEKRKSKGTARETCSLQGCWGDIHRVRKKHPGHFRL